VILGSTLGKVFPRVNLPARKHPFFCESRFNALQLFELAAFLFKGLHPLAVGFNDELFGLEIAAAERYRKDAEVFAGCPRSNLAASTGILVSGVSSDLSPFP
jgi:hypothetical protein